MIASASHEQDQEESSYFPVHQSFAKPSQRPSAYQVPTTKRHGLKRDTHPHTHSTPQPASNVSNPIFFWYFPVKNFIYFFLPGIRSPCRRCKWLGRLMTGSWFCLRYNLILLYILNFNQNYIIFHQSFECLPMITQDYGAPAGPVCETVYEEECATVNEQQCREVQEEQCQTLNR